MSRLIAVLCTLIMTCSAAQAKTTRHGDVTLIDNRGGVRFLPKAVDRLVFSDIPIGKPLVVRYHVRSLPQLIYPSGFTLNVPEAEYRPLQEAPKKAPWHNCVIRASLTTPDGARFYSRTIALGKDRHGAELSGRYSKIFFSFSDYQMDGKTSLPRHLSYNLQIEVLRPSSRGSDKLTVDASTSLAKR